MDFRNTVIIMTSNIGVGDLYKLDEEEGYVRNKDVEVQEILGRYFAPEFCNRCRSA